MRHSEHPGICAVAGAAALVLAIGGCSASHPAENASNHNYAPCIDGTIRCGSAEVVERCEGGQWHPELACSDDTPQCVGGFCVGENAPQLHYLTLRNGVDGYAGCTDISVAVPEGAGFYEITPEDEQHYLYHLVWTGS